jgi:hypothetical protein
MILTVYSNKATMTTTTIYIRSTDRLVAADTQASFTVKLGAHLPPPSRVGKIPHGLTHVLRQRGRALALRL